MAPPPHKFPVYQIDFTAAAAGKRVAATKRRVRWRFGFPNLEALAAGQSGTDCRGEEHEVVIVWSVTSGKRQIMYDGKEVHYSASRTGIIDHSWSSKGNHVMKVVCHAAPPMSATPGFRQYDLFIDGQSFFTMPKVYELGIRGVADRPSAGARYDSASAYRSPATSIAPPRTPHEEELELQRAINASLEESRQHLQKKQAEAPTPAPAPPSTPAGADLFGGGDMFASPPAPALPHSDASMISYSSAPTQYGAAPAPYPGAPPAPAPYPAAPAPYPAAPTPPAYGGAPPAAAAYPGAPPSGFPGSPPPFASPGQTQLALPPSQPPAPAYPASPADPNFLAPMAAPSTPAAPAASPFFDPAMHGSEDPFAPKPPTHSDIANEILKGYTGSPAQPTSAYPAQSPGPNGAHMPAVATPQAATPQSAAPAAAPLSMNVLTVAEEGSNLSELEKAMRKLVNVEHIDEPAEEKVKLTMKAKEDEDNRKKKNKSQPLPPAAHRMVGSHATLGQIGSVKPKKDPKEGIMNAPPQPWDPAAAQAGMLVVHGQPNQGPPPLQQRGFGVVHGQQPYYGAPQPMMGMGSHPHAQPQYGYPQQPQYR